MEGDSQLQRLNTGKHAEGRLIYTNLTKPRAGGRGILGNRSWKNGMCELEDVEEYCELFILFFRNDMAIVVLNLQ